MMGFVPRASFLMSAKPVPSMRELTRWPSPSPHSRKRTSSKTAKSTLRGMTSPPKGCRAISASCGTEKRRSSMDHVPTTSTSALSGLAPMGVMSRHETSESTCMWATSPSVCLPISMYATWPSPVATTTCDGLAAATTMLLPAGGVQLVMSCCVAQSTSRTAPLVTCTYWSCTTLPHHTVCASASKPGISASSSSSSSFRPSTRVSPTKLSTRYVSCSSVSEVRRLQTPLTPGSSTAACSSTPTPLRTMRSEPAAPAPEQVTTCPWPWRSRSTTERSTIGPRLVIVSSTSKKLEGRAGSGGWLCRLRCARRHMSGAWRRARRDVRGRDMRGRDCLA